MERSRAGTRIAVGILMLWVAIVLVACPSVRGRRGEPAESGFLGDYSKLKKDEDRPAQLVYVSPLVDWTRFRAIELDSVTLWANKETAELPPDDQQMLTDLLYTALYEALDVQFTMVESAGSDVLRIRAALTQADGANVPMRSISTLLPQMLIVGTAVGLSADTAATVGTATVEVEMLDTVSGRRAAAAVDERAGVKNLFSGNTFKKWGDVQAACDFWAKRVVAFLVKQGVRPKPSAPPFESPD